MFQVPVVISIIVRKSDSKSLYQYCLSEWEGREGSLESGYSGQWLLETLVNKVVVVSMNME